ncbi:MAG TPA: rRNA maturation RNase YbeY [Candidatus Dormibacteraeota bacterium]|nr:rRNA maturation RNase YbeY [Candidatus Dormibacteraeota bacterium]
MVIAPGLSQADRELASEAELDLLLTGALGDLELGAAGVNCRLTTPREVRRLNREFAGLDRTTDVLAFPARASRGGDFLLPASEEGFLGDLVISVRTAVLQAEVAGSDPVAELRLLAVHGLLHLLGHDHGEPGPAAHMTRATQQLLGRDAARRGGSAPLVPQLQPSA